MSKKQSILYFDTKESLEYMAKVKAKIVQMDTISDMKERQEKYGKILKKMGKNVRIMPGFRCEYGNVDVGDNVLINFDCCFLDAGGISIGDNVWIAPRVSIYSIGHPLAPEGRLEVACLIAPVVIEDNVWVGGNVVINPGVTIGKNSVIGSGSVVTKDIPEGVLAYGNPCRVVRELGREDFFVYERLKKECRNDEIIKNIMSCKKEID